MHWKMHLMPLMRFCWANYKCIKENTYILLGGANYDKKSKEHQCVIEKSIMR